MKERRIYLDSSGLVKRYVKEEGTEAVDTIFRDAETGSAIICFSAWNLGEVAGAFNRYSIGNKAGTRELYGYFLNETARLKRSSALEIIPVTLDLISRSIEYVFKHRLYVADALQLASSIEANCERLVTSDSRVHEAVQAEGIQSVLV